MKKFFAVVILLMLYIPGDVFSQGNTFDYYSVDPVFSYSGTGFDSTHVVQPSVVKKDGVYYMYYAGLPGANQMETSGVDTQKIHS